MGERAGNDRRQRVEEQAVEREGEPGSDQRQAGEQQPADQRDRRADEDREQHEHRPQRGNGEDFQPIGPIGAGDEMPGQDLLDRLGVQGDAGDVLAERGGADVLQAGR